MIKIILITMTASLDLTDIRNDETARRLLTIDGASSSWSVRASRSSHSSHAGHQEDDQIRIEQVRDEQKYCHNEEEDDHSSHAGHQADDHHQSDYDHNGGDENKDAEQEYNNSSPPCCSAPIVLALQREKFTLRFSVMMINHHASVKINTTVKGSLYASPLDHCL